MNQENANGKNRTDAASASKANMQSRDNTKINQSDKAPQDAGKMKDRQTATDKSYQGSQSKSSSRNDQKGGQR